MEGEKIKEVLRKRGVSMSQLARYLNMSQQTLSAALQGDDVRTSLMEGAAEMLGESPAFFYIGEGAVSAMANNSPNATVTSSKDSLGLKVLEKQLDMMDRQVEILDKQLDTKDTQINSLLQVILKK